MVLKEKPHGSYVRNSIAWLSNLGMQSPTSLRWHPWLMFTVSFLFLLTVFRLLLYDNITPSLHRSAYPTPYFQVTSGEKRTKQKEEKSWENEQLSWVLFLIRLSFKPEIVDLEIASSSAITGIGNSLGRLGMF